MSRDWLLYLDDIIEAEEIGRYFSLDARIVWDVAVNHVPQVLAAVKKLATQSNSEPPKE